MTISLFPALRNRSCPNKSLTHQFQLIWVCLKIGYPKIPELIMMVPIKEPSLGRIPQFPDTAICSNDLCGWHRTVEIDEAATLLAQRYPQFARGQVRLERRSFSNTNKVYNSQMSPLVPFRCR